MRTYYFDTKDGIPVRDHSGIEFAASREAIEHSKELAKRLRADERCWTKSSPSWSSTSPELRFIASLFIRMLFERLSPSLRISP